MSCKDDGIISFLSNVPIIDWANVHPYLCERKYTPIGLQDLVASVQDIEHKHRKAKAVGSVFSLSRAPDSDDFVIDTTHLSRHLSQPFPTPSTPLASGRFRTPTHNAQWLGTLARGGLPTTGGVLIHVEAGIRIHKLLDDLASVGLAVPTMGAGGGQTLAGALSTSTHGSDVNLRMLGDAVRAVHLVGAGGQEWWIEGNWGAGATSGYTQLPLWCPDTKVIRDSDFLESVVVGIGRFGIIYSMVLEVVPQYRLEEERQERTWNEVRSALQAGVASGYTATGGVFNDFRSGFPLRHWGVVIDSASGSRAWVTRRWVTTNNANKNVDKKGFDPIGFLCTHDEVAQLTVYSLTTAVALTLINAGLPLQAIKFVGPVLAAPYFGLAADLITAASSFTTLGNFVATVIDRVKYWDNFAWGLDVGNDLIDDLIKEISGAVLAGQHDPPLRRGPSYQILDTHDYDLDGCFSVNSTEFFFDAASGSYLQFVDKVLEVAEQLGPLVGIVALRFVRKTTSKLGMQRFPRTVAVEVAVPRPGSANAQYIAATHALALKHGGIPHWGQEHALNDSQTEALYGKDLEPWRWALAETEAQVGGTFSSDFTRTRGLEVPATDTLAAYRTRRYVAAIVSGTA